jgi:hypothetical protein
MRCTLVVVLGVVVVVVVVVAEAAAVVVFSRTPGGINLLNPLTPNDL